jgi:GNAT superfamily N-acetyltransferase
VALDIVPVTPDRWDDLERLFGPGGAYANCWCTWFVLTSRGWEDTPPAGRRALMAGMVADGEEPGLLAYRDGEPVGWVAVGPRSRYARMMSPHAVVYRPLDDRPSWVINCFFVSRPERRSGVASALLDAAVAFAFDRGARLIEAYPLDLERASPTDASLYVGSLRMFLDAGFEEVARIKDRPVVRRFR